ncbi:MAG: hypothetical protein CMO55_13690 [Verrucomicrobiales bacterium]|nr:hypothetical protein [Verrucomicrobiales bacterium]
MGKSIKFLQDRERILLERAKDLEYKEVADGENLSIHFYFPADIEDGPDRPVILFFNGGGWDRGNIVEFAPHALYFIERGAVCGLVEYRNAKSHPESTPVESLKDGRSAVKFVRQHREQLHVDSDKVIVCGSGAGGNIAAHSAMKPKSRVEEESDSRPNAVILFSSIIDVEKGSYGFDQFQEPGDAKRACLTRFIDSGLPPMLIMHGTDDRLVPLFEVSLFAERMKKRKNVCELVELEGRDRNFFNLNVDPGSYEICLSTIDDFLDQQGLLPRDETADEARVISWREEDY